MRAFVELERDGDVALVWLNRPQVLNALSRQVLDELDAAVAEVDGSDARVMVLAGRGERAFCAGADIKEFKTVATTVEARSAHYREDVCLRIESMSIPTIAALHGYTFGGGLALAIACDIRIAADNTLFALPETGLGTFPGQGVTVRLPRLIGRSEAMLMIFSGQRATAAEAVRMGLVNLVVPQAELMRSVLQTAGKISDNAPLGVRYAKECIVRGERVPLEEGLKIEKDLNMFMDTTEDYVEGAAAFGERRKPRFVGR